MDIKICKSCKQAFFKIDVLICRYCGICCSDLIKCPIYRSHYIHIDEFVKGLKNGSKI